jgi:hypothetical protein
MKIQLKHEAAAVSFSNLSLFNLHVLHAYILYATISEVLMLLTECSIYKITAISYTYYSSDLLTLFFYGQHDASSKLKSYIYFVLINMIQMLIVQRVPEAGPNDGRNRQIGKTANGKQGKPPTHTCSLYMTLSQTLPDPPFVIY